MVCVCVCVCVFVWVEYAIRKCVSALRNVRMWLILFVSVSVLSEHEH